MKAKAPDGPRGQPHTERAAAGATGREMRVVGAPKLSAKAFVMGAWSLARAYRWPFVDRRVRIVCSAGVIGIGIQRPGPGAMRPVAFAALPRRSPRS